MNEVQEKKFKRLKLVNMIALVITAISTISSLMALPTIIDPSIYKSKVFGKDGTALYEAFNNPFFKIFAIVSLVVTAIFLVFLFLANKKIKEKQLPQKKLYYIYLLVSVIQLIYGLAFEPKVNIQDVSNNLFMSIMSVVTTLVLNLPVIFAIIYIFKLEEEVN